MTITALLLGVAFVAGGATSWIFAFGRGWRASDQMWQAEWDAWRGLARDTWVAADALAGSAPAELGAHPARWVGRRSVPSRPVPAEHLIVRLHAERGEAWVRREGGAHQYRPSLPWHIGPPPLPAGLSA